MVPWGSTIVGHPSRDITTWLVTDQLGTRHSAPVADYWKVWNSGKHVIRIPYAPRCWNIYQHLPPKDPNVGKYWMTWSIWEWDEHGKTWGNHLLVPRSITRPLFHCSRLPGHPIYTTVARGPSPLSGQLGRPMLKQLGDGHSDGPST